MKLIITLKEMLDAGIWTDYCRIQQLDEWYAEYAETISQDEEFTLTREEAYRLGISIKVINECDGRSA